tara:strand:- start:309 stop:1310 length:1002 start_codon:yes stop_codon:yes gene_type:complete
MSSDAKGVVPETTEETAESVFDVSAEEIARAGNASQTFIESLTSKDADESEPEEVEEEEEGIEEDEESEEEEVDQDEEELEDTEEEPKGDSPGIKKRIGKLVERAKRAEAEAERLGSELENQRGEPQQEIQTPGAERFETVNDPKKLDKMEADAEHLREWLMTNPEGGEYQDRSGAQYDVDYESAKALHVQTDRDLRKNIPSQRANLHQRFASIQQANQRFPWMADNGSSEFREMMGILSNNPRAKKFYETDPNAALLFGYAMEGWKSEHAKEQQKGKTVKTVEQAPTSVPTSTRAKRATKNTSGAAKKSKLHKQALQSGDVHDVRSYLESIL